MSIQPDADLLITLRNNLRHFEETDDSELSPHAADIKRLLLRRIANIEAAIKTINKMIQRNPEPKTPPDSED